MIGDLSRWNFTLLVVLVLLLPVSACTSGGSVPSSLASTTSTTPRGNDATSTTVTPTTTSAPYTSTTVEAIDLGPELVFNGDFSVGDVIPTGWEFRAESPGQSLDYTTENEVAHISLSGPVEDGVPWPEARLLQDFTVTPHTEYRFAAQVRSPAQGRLFLALGFRDADGGEILMRGPGEPTITESDWSTVEAEVESPHLAASAYVILRLAIRPEVVNVDSLTVDVNQVSVRELLGS